MKFRNLSSITVPKELWRRIAQALNLDKDLPKAEEDGVLLYVHKRLRVIINKSIDRGSEKQEVILGSYSCGRISLFPCPRCTNGFLTLTYLHEICHAWLSQFHEDLYDECDTCNFCEAFALYSYQILGGTTVDRFCWNHDLSIKKAEDNFLAFCKYADKLTNMKPLELRKLVIGEFKL